MTVLLLRAVVSSLNEGRSVNPGYTRPYETVDPRLWIAQRRPERQPRLHAVNAHGERVPFGALNEGRSVNPGYTFCDDGNSSGVDARSTKAGASTPATLPVATSQRSSSEPAQRRPERQPRLHVRVTRPSRCLRDSLNEGRSVNPGYTWCCGETEPDLEATLNEGRSVNPGYTAKFCKRAVSGQTIARPRVREPRQRRVCVHFTRFRTIPRQNGQDQAVETALTAARHTRFPRITEGSQISQSTQGWPSSCC